MGKRNDKFKEKKVETVYTEVFMKDEKAKAARIGVIDSRKISLFGHEIAMKPRRYYVDANRDTLENVRNNIDKILAKM